MNAKWTVYGKPEGDGMQHLLYEGVADAVIGLAPEAYQIMRLPEWEISDNYNYCEITKSLCIQS